MKENEFKIITVTHLERNKPIYVLQDNNYFLWGTPEEYLTNSKKKLKEFIRKRKCINKEYGRNANLILWNLLDFMVTEGYLIEAKHVRRNSNEFNIACDKYAGALRKEMLNFSLTANKELGIIE